MNREFIFDKSGAAVAHLDGDDVFANNGKVLAFISGDTVYRYTDGRQVGTFQFGWFRDLNGYCVAFINGCKGGVVTPVQKVPPVPAVNHITPVRPIPTVPRVPAVPKLGWSSLSFLQYIS